MSQNERCFIADYKRTPDEAAQAAIDWDSTMSEFEDMKDVEL
jgi:hypothetical protein